MPTMDDITGDLVAETEDLVPRLRAISEDDWDRPTPAPGWAVRDQVSHLAAVDETAVRAATDPDGYAAEAARRRADPSSAPDPLARGRDVPGADVLRWFEDARATMLDVFRGLDPKARIPWAGPSMSAVSFATARLMETWAHGQDVVDALALHRPPTDRLRHVCHIGVLARPYSYTTRGLEPSTVPVRVELAAPSGATWTWGDEGAADVVRGTALDFALVATRRRHPADTDLEAVGPAATEWLEIAQAFAGPPGAGRQPGQFPKATAHP